jgi:hypothetical protein
MSNPVRLKCASIAILLSAAASASAAPVAIALSGAAAPSGGTYSAFANPVVNANGQVAFNASLTGGTSTSGIFTGTPGSVQAVALQGTAAPNGEPFGSLYTSATTELVTLNSSGQLAFNAPLTGGTPTSGVFTGTSAASLQAVALQGSAAPAGGNYSAFLSQGTNTAYSPLINNAGQLAFQSSLTGGTAASGIFTGTSSATLQTVALVGGAAPTPPGGTYATVVTVPTLNNAGQVAFVSIVSGEQGIFAGAPGSVQTVMFQGTTAPGTGGALYGTPTTSYSYNNAGQVGFITTLTGGTSTNGVFAGAPGSVQPVALQGTTAPGTGGGTYGGLSSVTINGKGQAAFTAASLSGGTATSGLFFGAPGSVQPVALAGGTAPDGETYASFASTELPNNAGQVAFIANLSGADVVAGTNSIALFAGAPGSLQEIVRQGEVINVDAPGTGVDDLTVSSINLLVGSGGQDGKGSDFSDTGDLAYRLTFTDGSSGVFESTVSAVPEPASLGLLAAGATMLLGRSRRPFVKRR